MAAKPPVFLPKSSLVRYWEPGELKKILSAKTRFYIRVLFRQNATWQGSVEWPEGRRRVNFRSVLELGEMLLETLERMDKPGRGSQGGLWTENGFSAAAAPQGNDRRRTAWISIHAAFSAFPAPCEMD